MPRNNSPRIAWHRQFPKAAVSLQAQVLCQRDLSLGLYRLTELVNETPGLPAEERLFLLNTIEHLCSHIHEETKEMRNEIKDRRN